MIRLLDLREDKDLKQKDIAKILGISRSFYSRLELNEYNIKHKHLIILANFYNTSTDYILELTNEIIPYTRNNNNKLRLKELRKSKNLVGKEMAYILNLSQQQYSSLENGNFNITYDKLITLATFYNTSVDYILGLTNETKPYPKDNKKTT